METKNQISGAFSSMPAVNTFAMYASLSILINFFLQITAFIALLSLDCKRTEVNFIKGLIQKYLNKNLDCFNHALIVVIIQILMVI